MLPDRAVGELDACNYDLLRNDRSFLFPEQAHIYGFYRGYEIKHTNLFALPGLDGFVAGELVTRKLLLGDRIEEKIVPIDRLNRPHAVVSERDFISVAVAGQFGLLCFNGGALVIAYLGFQPGLR